MSRFVYSVIAFYVVTITILVLLNVNIDNSIVEIPEKPEIPGVSRIPLFGFLIETAAFIVLLFGFILSLIFVTFTELIPLWLNSIIFIPIIIFMIYEIVARLIRGS